MTISTLTPLERAVLTMLLDGEHPILASLRRQLPELSVKSRETTGVGFFVELGVSSLALRAPLSSAVTIGDVEATIDGLQRGAGFVLVLEDGLLAMLEGYSYDEPWPEVVTEFSLRYVDASRGSLTSELARSSL